MWKRPSRRPRPSWASSRPARRSRSRARRTCTQTGQLLQARGAHHLFLHQLATILTTLADLAERTKDALLPGRTHGQHAVPATLVPGQIEALLDPARYTRLCQEFAERGAAAAREMAAAITQRLAALGPTQVRPGSRRA